MKKKKRTKKSKDDAVRAINRAIAGEWSYSCAKNKAGKISVTSNPTKEKIRETAMQLAFTLKDFTRKQDQDAAIRLTRKILAVTT